jgi:tetratricopeptide (TPR) repeat protein
MRLTAQAGGIMVRCYSYIAVVLTLTGSWVTALPVAALTMESYQAYQQAVSFERPGKLTDAESAIRRAIAMDPDDPYNLTKLAGILAASGKTQEAIGLFRKALQMNPQDTMLNFSLGNLYEQTGDYTQALMAYEKALKANPNYRFGLLNTARTLTHLRQTDRALADYQAFLQAYPDHFEGRRYFGKLLLATNHPKEAIDQFKYLQAHYPGKFSDNLDLARALNGSQNPTEALQELNVALQKASQNKADVYAEMAKAHIALKQNTLATSAYDDALRANPERVELLEQKAQLLKSIGRFAEAEQAYLTYLDKVPDDAEARYDLGLVYMGQQAYDNAIPQFQQVLQAQPPITAARKDLAYAYHMQGQLPNAIPIYEALLADPTNTDEADKAQTRQNLAIAYHQTKQFEKALALYRDLAQQMPENTSLKQDYTNVLLQLGDGAKQEGDAVQAIAYYEEAAKVTNPFDVKPLLAQAQLYSEQQRWEDAERLYQDVLGKDPNQPDAKLFQTRKALKDGDPARAGQLLQELQTQSVSQTPEFAVLTGDVARQQGNVADALLHYEKAVGLNPNQPRWWVAVGETAQAQNQQEKAIQAYQKALGLSKPGDAAQAPVYYNLGVSYYQTQQWDAAENAFMQALQLDPNLSAAAYALGTTLEAQKKTADAIRAYEHYRETLPPASAEATTLTQRIVALQKQQSTVNSGKPASTKLPAKAPAKSVNLKKTPAVSKAPVMPQLKPKPVPVNTLKPSVPANTLPGQGKLNKLSDNHRADEVTA